ncbi:hypothetical protein G6F65_021537 [Rhizopus arrhizus]|nr:hypothetical protein G6F65_021537 [Rhizopus arrhizus]
MELFDNLMLGFSVAFTPENLLYALLGCILGTLIGVLPGIGPVPTIAMLLPITYLLRRPIRRLHDGDSCGIARGNVRGGDRAGRSPDGPQRSCWRRAGNRRAGFVLRRLRGHAAAGRLCAPAG